MKKLRRKILEFLTPEPEIQAEYVDKVVFLLRRDFTTSQQNDIILSIANKLSSLRDKDMRDMEERYSTLQRDTNGLRGSIAKKSVNDIVVNQ